MLQAAYLTLVVHARTAAQSALMVLKTMIWLKSWLHANIISTAIALISGY